MNSHHDGPPGGENDDAGREGGQPRLANRRLDLARLLALPDRPLPWRCDRLAADGYVTVLTGEGGEGKSFLTLALAKGVAEGEDAAGIACRPGRAILFDAENGEPLMARRLKAAGVRPGALDVVDADGLDIRRDHDAFVEAIETWGADLVVLDSLRILASGAKESEGDDMAPVMTAIRHVARRTRAAVVVVHHRGKGDNASAYRGSSVIRDQADMLFMLSRAKGDPAGSTRRSLSTSKCRIDLEPPTRWLRIETDAGSGRVSIEAAEPFEGGAAAPPTKREELVSALRGRLSTRPQRRADLARAVGRDGNDGQVRRALMDLAEEGYAVQVGEGWLLSQPPSPPEDGWMADGVTEPDADLPVAA
jgi:hypothetical protein